MAKAAGTSVGDVKIKSITELPSRRSSSDSSWMDRCAGRGFIRVDFIVALASANAATKTLSAMNSDNINKALVHEGLLSLKASSCPNRRLNFSSRRVKHKWPAQLHRRCLLSYFR